MRLLLKGRCSHGGEMKMNTSMKELILREAVVESLDTGKECLKYVTAR